MQHQNTPGHGPGDSDDSLDQAVLCLLVDHPGGLWSLSELNRSLTLSRESRLGEEPPRHDTEDAIQRLYAAGMVHRLGQFVFATRSAHAVERLAG